MAMACSVLPVSGCSTSLTTAPFASSTTTASTSRRSCIAGSSTASSLFGARLTAASVRICRIERTSRRNGVIRANAAEGPIDVVAGPPSTGETEAAPPTSLKILSESDLLKKKAKKLELRRKRLVRKRHLRKKGRWPPSKVKKNKNV